MIPKTINYFWFGSNPKSKKVKFCIDSWKKFCPDYTIVEWNENNFDISVHPYTKRAYEEKRWAFISDYARMKTIFEFGGIYLDTDVEIIRPIDSLTELYAYFGFENSSRVASGLGFGSEKDNPIIYDILCEYDKVVENIDFEYIACPYIETKVFEKHGLEANGNTQMVENTKVFSPSFFSPKNYFTGKCHVTSETYSIHHYDASWKSGTEKFKRMIRQILK